ncbi:MAG: sprT domain-containing protein [Crocinitomicaceae bacterium]
MKTKRSFYESILTKYLPIEYVDMVVALLLVHPVIFKVVKPRKTKLGDFRANIKNKKPQITVNGNLNQYSFLITTLHEFAHLINFKVNGPYVGSHGKEWKKIYSELILPVIELKKLPLDVETALLNSLIKVKASSCSDVNLNRTLIKYDEGQKNHVTLETINKNSIFVLNGITFRKGNLRRTRYYCVELKSNKPYLVNRLAHVKEIKDEG